MTKAQSIACRIRWLLLILALLCLIAGFWYIIGAPPFEGAGSVGTPFIISGLDVFENDRLGMAANGLIYLAILLIMQWLFLRPKRNWQIKITSRGRPLRSAVIAAAFVYMLLTTALIATLLELPNWWGEIYEKIGYPGCWVAMAFIWLIWTVIFLVYSKQTDHYTWMGKIIRGLISGSIMELFIATAVFAWNPHKEECYCARGSYTGLVSAARSCSGHSDRESSCSLDAKNSANKNCKITRSRMSRETLLSSGRGPRSICSTYKKGYRSDPQCARFF
ncbi:MAG: hypothetical protein IID32_04965 [Planctomycetes bacterium]|nr:hypothetical protein [Planctomycetota bacterium]